MSQQINLFNPAFEQKKQLFTAATMALALGVLVLGLTVMGVYAKLRVAALQREADAGAVRLEQVQKRLTGVSAEFAPRQKDPQLAAELAEAEGQLAGLRRVSGIIAGGDLGNTQGFAEYFRALARQRVEGLWLTGVNIGASGQDLGVRGRALDPALVPGFLGRLRNEQVMQGKPVGSLQIGEAAAVKTVGKDGKESAAPAPYVEFSLQSAAPGKTGAQP
jgi:hypothetical protein